MPINPQTVPTMLKTNKIIISLKCSEPRIELILPNAYLDPEGSTLGNRMRGQSTIKREKSTMQLALLAQKKPLRDQTIQICKRKHLHFVVNYNEQVKTYLEGK